MTKIRAKLSSAVIALLVAWPLAGAKGQLTQAPLFDSVDENLNPVSMADFIDGRPLVLGCGTCS